MAPHWTDRSIYHFTPLANFPAILRHGLVSINEQRRLGLPLQPLAGPPIMDHRSRLPIPVEPGGNVLDYVPFYFSNLTHMLLLIIYNKVVDEQRILHIEMPLTILERYPAVFTDAPTIPGSQPNFYTDPADLQNLDWDAIDAPAWQRTRLDLRSPRLAELLVYRHVPIREATRLIVWDHQVEKIVRRLFEEHNLQPPQIETDPTFYFFDTTAEDPKPPIAGPVKILAETRQTIQSILTARRHEPQARFADLQALRQALRDDLAALPETAELADLETDNKVHFEDVGAHTLRVVSLVRQSPEIARLDPDDRILLDVAAFLHDIGKGPKSRWHSSGGKQQIDMNHPVKALPMLERILTQEVQQVSPEAVDLLCRLVVYHDLIGGILVSGRRIEELLSAFHTERELEMLFILARADSVAINPDWEHPEVRERLKQDILRAMRENQRV